MRCSAYAWASAPSQWYAVRSSEALHVACAASTVAAAAAASIDAIEGVSFAPPLPSPPVAEEEASFAPDVVVVVVVVSAPPIDAAAATVAS
jgi:hypothetical protein